MNFSRKYTVKEQIIMKGKYLTVRVNISVATVNLDFFQDVVYLTMSPDAGEWPFQAGWKANNAINCMQKLFWVSVCCVSAEPTTAFSSVALIELQCPEFVGGLERQLVDEKDGHFAWTPELSRQIDTVSGVLRKEFARILCDLANSYYSGSLRKLGGQNEFRLRYEGIA